MQNMPALFIGHGSPMNAIESNAITRSWQKLSTTLPKPRAILVISAHWYITDTRITSQDNNSTIHDFYGFPEELSAYQYKSFGSQNIAQEIAQLIDSNITPVTDQWGLDHGAWSMLTHIYPHANMPILQLSIDSRQTAKWHFEMGQKLAILREHGILVIASGNIVHNLAMIAWRKPNQGYDWAIQFDEHVINQINQRNYSSLIDYHNLSSFAIQAIPTPEHYLPLLYILGMISTEDDLQIFNQSYQYGSLSMTSLLVK